MNPIKKISFLLAAASAAGVLQAQQNYSSSPSAASDQPGVLGQSFTELGFGVQSLRHTSDEPFDATLRGNIPVSQNVDVSLGYGYSWLNGDTDIHNELLAADTKFYTQLDNHMKPYIGGLVGYQWAKTDFDHQFPVAATSQDRWVWGVSAGVEIPVGTFAFTPHVGYVDSMESNSLGHYNYGAEAQHWFTQTVGSYADVSYNDLRHENSTWTYVAGLRFRF